MFKSRCEYLLKRLDRSDYEELMDDLLDLYWDHVVDRMLGEGYATAEQTRDEMWMTFFEMRLDHLIWGWYPGGRGFSERYRKP